jgi:hypothetical protein
MKKCSILLVILLLSAGTFFQELAAQEKTKEEQEKEIKIQLSIDQQKKAMAEQKKAQAEAEDNLDRQKSEIEVSVKKLNDDLVNDGRERDKLILSMPRGDRSFNFNEPFSSAAFAGQDLGGWFGHSMGDSERTSWSFSKTVKENTFSRDYTFDVEKSSKTVVMSVMGDCKSGEIRIKIVMPNGKSYSDILIDESGNLNWRKSFAINETENQDKTGDWKFQISSTKATGFFKISLQTF